VLDSARKESALGEEASEPLQSATTGNLNACMIVESKTRPFQGEIRLMKLTARVPVTAGLTALLLMSATGCARLRSGDQLNKGVAAFKNAKFEDATNYFQNAVNIDPSNQNAKLYLGTTYSSQVVPNLNTPDNLKLAQKAHDVFEQVLVNDPNDLTALRQIASLDRITGKIKQAKDEAFDNATAAVKGQGLPSDDGEGNVKLSKDNCAKLSALNTELVNEGLQNLEKAVEINPTYEEAMTYLSLMERRKADLECGNKDAIKADLQQSDMWAQKSMGARKENERRKEEKSHGVAM
jgi:tetratricopeptide (TPR) repeat protein